MATNKSRLEFLEPVKQKLRERVAFMCSNPLCRRLTVKKNAKSDGIVRSGKASHIYSASKTGPRSKHNKKPNFIESFKNGIWLCDKCSREVDDNQSIYTVSDLLKWKSDAENYVEGLVTHDARLRDLRLLVTNLLSNFRVLNSLPFHFDTSFRNEREMDITRQIIETEQALFENEFLAEADILNKIYQETEMVYDALKQKDNTKYLNISDWKNKIVQTIMLDIMHFKKESYNRYLTRESKMVSDRILEINNEKYGRTIVTLNTPNIV
jgi:hypothetical protein